MKYTITYTKDINERMLDLFRAAVQDLAGDYTIERITDAARTARNAHIEFICAITDHSLAHVVAQLRNGGSAAFRASHHGDMAIRMITAMKMAQIDGTDAPIDGTDAPIDGTDAPTVGNAIAPYMDFLGMHISFHFYEDDDDDVSAVANPKPDASRGAENPHTSPWRSKP
jgi:hypothetical protein